MRKKVLKNISWLFFDNIIRILGGLSIGIWVARYLGPSDFGVLNYALAYTALFMLFVKLGLDQIIVREIVRKAELTHYLLGTAFVLKLVGALIAISAIYISVLFLETDTLIKSVIFILSIGFILQSVDVIDYFYQSKVLSKYVVVARSSAFILSSILKVFFIVYKFSVIYFAIANTIDFLLAGVFLIYTYKKTGYEITQWRFSKNIAIRLLKFSWPLAISAFLISVHMRIDQVMIGNMLDKERVGIYSIAVILAEAWYFIPAIIVNTLMPYFVELRENNNELYYFRLTQLYSLMFWMGVGVGVFVTFFGKDIIRVLFGSDYVGAYEALIFHIWAGIFVAQSSAKGIWVISENLQLYRIVTNLVAVLINISLNIILIPIYGISGAAIATLFTRFFNNWITPILIKPYRENTIISIKSINPFYVYSRRCCGKN